MNTRSKSKETKMSDEETEAKSVINQIVMTPQMLQSLISSIQTLNVNQNPQSHPTTSIQNNVANFSGCKARFGGSYDENVDAFIDAVSTYKECLNISNDHAIKGLSMLLTDSAATWWQGIKSTTLFFDEAMISLQHAFGQIKPAWQIYLQLFSKEQQKEKTDLFISNARALLSRLTGRSMISEYVQLDMVYGLLNYRIKSKITRESVGTFKELIEAARIIEQNFNYPENKKSKADNDQSYTKYNKPQCSFCKFYGHTKTDCRKFARQQVEKPQNLPHEVKHEIKHEIKQNERSLICYGCNTPGYVKSNCPNCNKKSSTTNNTTVLNSDFLIANFSAVKKNTNFRPITRVEINNHHGMCFLDSGAQCNMAGAQLTHILENQNIPYEEKSLNMTLADGKTTPVNAKLFTVLIGLGNRYHTAVVVSIPSLKNTRTLLGADFIGDANILIDIRNNSWFYGDQPNDKYYFVEDPVCVNNTAINAGNETLNLLELREDETKDLQPEKIEKVNNFLLNNSNLFEKSLEPTPFIEHRIQLIDDLPVAVPPYRLSEKNRENLKKEIDKLLLDDVIEECESPYAAPVILVPKKDGSIRLTVDYRKLNQKTRPDRYPLPRIDDTLQAVGNVQILSTLDMKAGYHQVSVQENDRDKTAFVCPFGTFRYKRMPFGLCNAPATFQRLIDRFRAGLQDIHILAYLDDIIILSNSFDSHLNDLEKVFRRLEHFKLKLNREKCKFCSTSVKYLGHILSPNGITPDPEKTLAITKRTAPKNIKQLLSFIQTCSWYRRFIENFAEIARPLTSLTRKDATWKWEMEQENAFNELKRRLITEPILKQSDPTLPYTVKTDASSYALGACLLQGEGENEKPIEYASRLLLPAEKNYSTTEREALAVVWAITNKFRGYLECAVINVRTDHQPLRWLMTLKTPSGRLARWALALQPFNINIDYVPGKSNVVADMLSRPVLDENMISLVTVELPHKSALITRNEQLTDPDIEKIIKCFENTDDDLNYIKWTDRGYVIQNGVLYRYVPEMDEEEAQLVIPKLSVDKILKEYHDSPLSGHYGFERTYQKIAQRYYWTGMRRNIADYVHKCIECQRYKSTNLKPAGLLQTPVQAQRFEVISIDLFGPLPQTSDGYTWIYIIEDTASKWVELFPLITASAENCSRVLIDEIILRYGVPRRVISDNGVQFISSIMQQVAHCLGFKQSLNPVYHPESNPVERKNRDMKTQLSILVKNDHISWKEKLSSIRFAINTSRCQTTGYTPAYLTFGREMRTPDDVNRDLRIIVENENFASQILPYLKLMSNTLHHARDINEKEQDRSHKYADQKRREGLKYNIGDKVLINSHGLSNASKAITKKFMPKRDGPYIITRVVSPTTVEVANPDNMLLILGKYHISDLTPFVEQQQDDELLPQPAVPIRKRGRPPNNGKKLIIKDKGAAGAEASDTKTLVQRRSERIAEKERI